MLLVTNSGMVFSAGEGAKGALGLGDEQDRDTPRLIDTLQNLAAGTAHIVAVRAVGRASMVLSAAGEVYSFGENHSSCLGVAQPIHGPGARGVREYLAPSHLLVPTRVNLIPYPVAAFDVSMRFSMFVTTTGLLYRCGNLDCLPTPVSSGGKFGAIMQATFLDDKPVRFRAVSCSDHHALLLSEDHRVYVMGKGLNSGEFGFALGTGQYVNAQMPTLISTLPTHLPIVQVSAREKTSFAIASDGRMFAWGQGALGRTDPPEVSEHQLVWMTAARQKEKKMINRAFPVEFRCSIAKTETSPVRMVEQTQEAGFAVAGFPMLIEDRFLQSNQAGASPFFLPSRSLIDHFGVTSYYGPNPLSCTLNVSMTQRVYKARVLSLGQRLAAATPGGHGRVMCDGCRCSPIVGARYSCEVCPDFDLCENCRTAGKPIGQHRPEHAMKKIDPPSSSKLDPSTLPPIKICWDLPYVPLDDSFFVWKYKRGDEGKSWSELIHDPHHPADQMFLLSNPSDPKLGEEMGMGFKGERVIEDLPEGQYVGVYQVGTHAAGVKDRHVLGS
jgi:hypothetical protein